MTEPVCSHCRLPFNIDGHVDPPMTVYLDGRPKQVHLYQCVEDFRAWVSAREARERALRYGATVDE